MKEVLLNKIYQSLVTRKAEDMPSGLDGNMGIYIFLKLFQALNKSIEFDANKWLNASLAAFSKLPFNFVHGLLGVGWGIRFLIKNKLIREDGAEIIYNTITLRRKNLLETAPIPWFGGEALFSTGIYMPQLADKSDSLEWYIHEEHLIEMIDECEVLLSCPIKGVFSPQDMNVSMLHSILFFLHSMERLSVYPFMVEQLLKKIPDLYIGIKEKVPSDDYVYCFLCGKKAEIPFYHTDDELFNFMREIGFYSLVYETSELFISAYNQVERKKTDFLKYAMDRIEGQYADIKVLCGWGYGLLNMKKWEQKKK